MSTAVIEQSELTAAQTEWAEADQDWRDVKRRARALEHGETIDGKRLDGVDRVVARTQLEEDRRTAAVRLGAARARLRAAKIADANEKLAELAPKHAETSKRVLEARREAEKAYARLLIAGEDLRAAQNVEGRHAKAMLEAAQDAAEGEARDQIRSDLSVCGLVPTFLNDEGFPAGQAERPTGNLFGGDGNDIANPAFWLGTAQTVANLNEVRRHVAGRLQETLLEVEAER
jgi:hypothetical protein